MTTVFMTTVFMTTVFMKMRARTCALDGRFTLLQ